MEQENIRKRKDKLSDLWDLFFLYPEMYAFFSPGFVFALMKNLNFLVTFAPYLLHRALKISKMSGYRSVLG